MATGWNIINEGFMQGFQAISNLKLRASYGQTGNYNIALKTSTGTTWCAPAWP